MRKPAKKDILIKKKNFISKIIFVGRNKYKKKLCFFNNIYKKYFFSKKMEIFYLYIFLLNFYKYYFKFLYFISFKKPIKKLCSSIIMYFKYYFKTKIKNFKYFNFNLSNVPYLNNIYDRIFSLRFIKKRTRRSRRKKNFIKKFMLNVELSRLKIFKRMVDSSFFKFFYFLKLKRIKNLKKIVSIFDLFLKFRKKIKNFYNKKYYKMRIVKKKNNLYLILLTNRGKTVINYSSGKILKKNAEKIKDSSIYKNVRSHTYVFNSNKKYIKKNGFVNDRSLNNQSRNKKRRKSIVMLKQILQEFIKKLFILRIFKIKIFEIQRNTKRTFKLILRSLLRHGIKVDKYVNFNSRPHNNNKNIKYKKRKRR